MRSRRRSPTRSTAATARIIPILAVVRDDMPAYPLALPVAAAGRLGAARAAPALRAARARAARHGAAPHRDPGDAADVPDTVDYDPIEDATVLVAGRGRSYPALTVAIGERMGLIGALSIETARSYLGARDVDGVVIGDGFNRAVVEDFVEEIGADPRWRDLPVIVPPSARHLDPERMPNADQVGGDAAGDRRAHPPVRAHACVLGAAQAPRGVARPEGHRSRPKPA